MQFFLRLEENSGFRVRFANFWGLGLGKKLRSSHLLVSVPFPYQRIHASKPRASHTLTPD